MRLLDATHDPALESWVESANDPRGDFPIQNLPFGIFRRRGSDEPWRAGVAIGDRILDLARVQEDAAFTGAARVPLAACAAAELNDLMALGPPAWAALRTALSRALARGSAAASRLGAALVPQSEAEHRAPARIGDYSDFYASIHHATAVGRLMRPDNPLLPNYRWVPIAYHGRASSIRVSGHAFPRPHGQTLPKGLTTPIFGPSRRMDYELEVGMFVGPGNAPGTRIPVGAAEEHIFGLCVLNDWSARDIQAWEYQPLGPFLAKSFASTISPWIVTLEALAPFRVPWTRPQEDPQPLPYLEHASLRQAGGFDLQLEVRIETARMRAAGLPPQRLSVSNFRHSYWTVAQMIAHHTVNGCNLCPGDLIGSGTQSGPHAAEAGSLLELSVGGAQPLTLEDGEQRSFLEDGDRIVMRGWCERSGLRRIGTGEASATLLPACVE